MARDFTVLISSDTDISLNAMGKLLNMIETRGIVIEEIHPENLLSESEAAQGAAPRQKSIEEMAAEKGIGPITNVADLQMSDITDEEADAFMAAMEEVRGAAPRAEGLDDLLRDALEVQRTGCDHKGIGKPGCRTCDPRIYAWSHPSDEVKP